MCCFGTVGKLLCFLCKQSLRTFILKFVFDPATDFIEARSCRGLYANQFIHDSPLCQLYFVRRRFFCRSENRFGELGSVTDPRQCVCAAKEVGSDNLNALGGSGFLESVGTSGSDQVPALCVRNLSDLLLLHYWLDLSFDFIERLQMSILLVIHMNDVKAGAALH